MTYFEDGRYNTSENQAVLAIIESERANPLLALKAFVTPPANVPWPGNGGRG
jgi:hypothetical protein